MSPEEQIVGLLRHGMTCMSTIACVYIMGRVALPVVVRVLEFLEREPVAPPRE